MKRLFVLLACFFCTSFLIAQQKKKEESKKAITSKNASPTAVAATGAIKLERERILKAGAAKVFANGAKPAKKIEAKSGIPAVDFFYYVFDVFFSVTFKPGKLKP